MADFNWDDHPIVADPKSGGFSWDDHPVVSSAADSIPSAASASAGLLSSLPFAHQIGALGKTGLDVLSGSVPPSQALDEYRSERDSLKHDLDTTSAAHPKAAFAGGLAGAGLMPIGASPGAMAAYGGASALGNSNADLTRGEVGQAALDAGKGAAVGGVAGAAVQGALPYVQKGYESLSQPVADYLKKLADKSYLRASGASGAQVAKFRDGTLDALRKVTNFGSSPGDIAANAQASMAQSGENIGDILSNKLPGATVDRNTILNYLRSKISGLSEDESQTGLANRLQNESQNIQSKIGTTSEIQQPPPMTRPNYENIPPTVLKAPRPTPERVAQMGQAGEASQAVNLSRANESGYNPYDPRVVTENSTIPIAQANDIKGGYQSKVNWKTPNPDLLENNANTHVSDAYRQAVEDSANSADPVIGAQLQSENKNYGIMKDIGDVAEKRQNTLDQSPHGGLLDISSAGAGGGVGAVLGGPVGAVVGAAGGLAAKSLRPRYASMSAVSSDWLANTIKASPSSLGKWAPSLSAAAARGGNSLGATDYLLQQTDPDYRQHIMGLKNAQDDMAQNGDQ